MIPSNCFNLTHFISCTLLWLRQSLERWDRIKFFYLKVLLLISTQIAQRHLNPAGSQLSLRSCTPNLYINGTIQFLAPKTASEASCILFCLNYSFWMTLRSFTSTSLYCYGFCSVHHFIWVTAKLAYSFPSSFFILSSKWLLSNKIWSCPSPLMATKCL